MHGDAHVKGLRSTAASVAMSEALANGRENLVVPGDFLSQYRGTGLFKYLTDPFAAGNFAGAGMPGIIRKYHQVSCEEGRVRSTQVQQHTVAARNRNHSHAGYTRGRPNALHERKSLRSAGGLCEIGLSMLFGWSGFLLRRGLLCRLRLFVHGLYRRFCDRLLAMM